MQRERSCEEDEDRATLMLSLVEGIFEIATKKIDWGLLKKVKF
jgi:hypothetical protein